VGVDVNTASTDLLQHVAGLNLRQARNIVAYRNMHGRFTMRQQFLQVEGVGAKAYQQATGFLRIRDGENVLDSTAVHPETYEVVERMAQSLSVPVASLVANADLVSSLDLQQFVDEQVGLYTLEDIREELLRPGRDPRDQFVMPRFRDDVLTLEDLQTGMVLEGVVSNVTNFGAFVDIGVHQDGLVHISELSQRYVRDPREVVHVGQVVQVKVLGVVQALQRISLSMKNLRAALPSPPPPRKRTAGSVRRRRRRPAAAQVATASQQEAMAPHEPVVVEEVSMAEKLRALQARFQQVDKA
jgi:uncharacterized protein